MSKNIALKVENVSKSFRLPTEQASGIKQAVVNWIKGVRGYKEQKVLKDISFTVEEGDFFGIVGRNGSGKSTLLKLISQIYTPDAGEITVNGKLVPFIELGVGFNPELTGRENIYLNGALLGFSHDEVSAMYEDIVEFAELEEFMDQKLKNYSSGMQVRLAFSIAIKADTDILVLDEVLAVGDEAFQKKCFQYFAELKRRNKTVILVTHDMDSVQRFCNKAIMIEQGSIVNSGNPREVAFAYRDLFITSEQRPSARAQAKHKRENEYLSIKPQIVMNSDDKIHLSIEICPKKDMEDVVLTLEVMRDSGESVYRWVTDERLEDRINLVKGMSIVLDFEIENIFPNGEYVIQAGIKKRDRSKSYILLPEALRLDIEYRGRDSDGMRWRPGVQAKLHAG